MPLTDDIYAGLGPDAQRPEDDPYARLGDALPKAIGAMTADSQAAGRAIELSKPTGLHPEVVNGNLPAIEAEKKVGDISRYVGGNQYIQDYVTGIPLAAQVSQDDWSKLDDISSDAEKLRDHPYIKRIVDGIQQGFGGPLTSLSEEDRKNFPIFSKVIEPFTQVIQAAEAALRVPGAVIGGAAGTAGAIEEARRKFAAAQLGVPDLANDAEAWANRLERDFTLGLQIAGIETGEGMMLPKPPKVPRIKGVDSFEPKAKAAVEEAPKAPTITLDPVTQDILKNGEIPPPRVSAAIDALHIIQSHTDLNNLDGLMQKVQEAKTLERSPTAMEGFLQSVVGDRDVHVPYETMQKIYDGIEPKVDDKLFGYDEDIKKKLEAAAITGADVPISMAKFAAYTDPTVYEGIKDQLRLRDVGVSVEEAKELGKVKTEELEAEPGTVAEQAQVKAKKSLFLDPAFKEPLPSMTKADWERYSKNISEVDDEEFARLAQKEAKLASARQTPEWKKNEARIKGEVETDLRSRPDLVAARYLNEGILPTGQKVPKIKLDRAAVESALGKDALKEYTVSKGGADPETIAHVLDFQNGAALLDTLKKFSDARKEAEKGTKGYTTQLIDEETARRMEERYGDLKENIWAEALENANSSYRIKILSDEYKAIAEEIGTVTPFTKEQIISAVEKAAGEYQWSKFKSEAFRRAAEKHGELTQRALNKKDYQEALVSKQRQIGSMLMMKEARSFERELKKGEGLFDRYTVPKVKGVAQEWTDRIHAVLGDLGYKTGRNVDELARTLAGKGSLEDFVTDKIVNEAKSVNVAQFLVDQSFSTPYKDLTVNQWRGLHDSIAILDHYGKEDGFIKIMGDRMKLDAMAQEVASNLYSLPEKQVLDPKSLGSNWRNIKLSQYRPELLARWIDRRDPTGPFNRMFKMLSDAHGRKLDLNKADSQFFRGLKSFNIARLSESIKNDVGLIDPLTGKPMELTRDHVLGMIAHMGNDENWGKVTKGWKIDPDRLRDFVFKNSTKEDWDYVQAIWDRLEEKFPIADQTARELSGAGPRKVNARPIVTPFGTYKGGYIRLKPDPMRSRGIIGEPKAGAFAEEDWYNPLPRGSFLKERTGKDYPPLLSIMDMPRAFQETNHYIALRGPIQEAQKFFYHPEVRKAVDRAFGRETTDSFGPWLNDIATDGFPRYDQDKVLAAINTVAGAVRRNWTLAEMGYRVTTMEKHGLGALVNSVGEVGPINFGKATLDLLNPVNAKQILDQIKNESPMMRHRLMTVDRDMMNSLEHSAGQNGILATATLHAFQGVGFLDYMSAVPTYWAAKKTALRTMEEADAIHAAEQAVRTAHGGSTVVDLPPMLRTKNEGFRLATLAMSFWNATFNKYADFNNITKEGLRDLRHLNISSGVAKISRGVSKMLYTSIGLSMAEELISPTPMRDDESIAEWMAWATMRVPLSTLPFFREAARWILTGKFDPQYSGALSLVKSAFEGTHAMYQLFAGEDVTDRHAVRDIIQGPGAFIPLPGAGQLGTTVEGLSNLDDEEIINPVSDVWRLLTQGHAQPYKPR